MPGKTFAGRSKASHIALAAFGLLLFATFIGLGVWQVERRSWKLALIARVDERVQAQPVAAGRRNGRVSPPHVTNIFMCG